MKTAAMSHQGLGGSFLHTLRTLTFVLVCFARLVAPSLSPAAELKQDTLVFWDGYLEAARPQMVSQTPFLWVDQQSERLQHVRNGEILVFSAAKENPKPVPSGLIHDWIGAAFLPDTQIEDILSTIRDYGNYTHYYKPTVVDSKLLSRSEPCENYSMRVVNKEAVAETALDLENETCYYKVDDRRWYSITHTTRVQEVRHYGKANEEKLPPDKGSGYIWRLYSVARFEQRDGGTYVEVEAIALSRDVPVAVRWVVNPIVRRVSKNSILISLRQTKDAVRLTEDASKNTSSPISVDNHSRSESAPEAGVAMDLAPNPKR